MLGSCLKVTLFHSPHSDPRLQLAWNSAQLGWLLLPFSPLAGGFGIFIALIFTYKHQWDRICRHWPNRLLMVLSLWMIGAASLGRDRTQAFIGLANFLPFFFGFIGLSSLLQTPTQLRRLAWLLILPSLPIALIGWGQLFWGWSGPIQLWFLIHWPLDANGLPPGRMAAVFAHANVFASYLIVLFILNLGLWIEACRRLRRDSPSGKSNLSEMLQTFRPPQTWLQWSFLSLSLLANSIALLLSNSRNAWAVTVLACLAFALYQGWRWLVAIVAAAATSILGAAFAPAPLQTWLRHLVPAFFWMRLTDQGFDRPTGTLRITQWRFAWSLTQQRPWTGWGLRNFAPLYQDRTQVWMSHPHNLFLMLTAETGIPATLMFCGIVGWILYQGISLLRHWSAINSNESDRLLLFTTLTAFGACTLFSTLDVTLFDLRVNLLGWTLLAAIAGLVYQQRQPYSSELLSQGKQREQGARSVSGFPKGRVKGKRVKG